MKKIKKIVLKEHSFSSDAVLSKMDSMHILGGYNYGGGGDWDYGGGNNYYGGTNVICVNIFYCPNDNCLGEGGYDGGGYNGYY